MVFNTTYKVALLGDQEDKTWIESAQCSVPAKERPSNDRLFDNITSTDRLSDEDKMEMARLADCARHRPTSEKRHERRRRICQVQ